MMATKKSRTVTRKDGRELRRLAVYLPASLARKLAIHCASEDLDTSTVIEAAVREILKDSEQRKLKDELRKLEEQQERDDREFHNRCVDAEQA